MEVDFHLLYVRWKIKIPLSPLPLYPYMTHLKLLWSQIPAILQLYQDLCFLFQRDGPMSEAKSRALWKDLWFSPYVTFFWTTLQILIGLEKDYRHRTEVFTMSNIIHIRETKKEKKIWKLSVNMFCSFHR